jgi:signal transduction histidine kinase
MNNFALLHSRTFEDPRVRYLVALLTAAAALLAGYGLKPFLGAIAPYAMAFPAVAFTAWCCGRGPSLMAVAVALVGAQHWFFQPVHALRMVDTGEWANFFAFLLGSSIIVALGEVSRREKERLLTAQGELEEKVNQRTAELHTANQSLSDLTARLLHLQDDERRRIARDLHDSVGQTLVALGMNLSVVGNDIEGLMKMATVVKDSQELVRESVTSIRSLSYLLHPPLLDENGLSSALPWYIQGFAERSKIRVNLELPPDLVRFSRESEVAIFRIVQECLTNVIRHSESTTADIRITQSGSDVCVIVEDNGKGIPPEKLLELMSAGTPGVGIRGMRERIRQLNGVMEINSDGIGRGTVVVARLPLISRETPTAPTFSHRETEMPQDDVRS